jgi:hypothetical protein
LKEFNPARYDGVHPDPSVWKDDCRFLVSTYGHLAHACPGRSFALSAIKVVLVKYLNALHLRPQFTSASVPETSVGAIGRCVNPCVVAYSRRAARSVSSFCKSGADEHALLPESAPIPSRFSDSSAGQAVAVIGGAGFLGSRLVEMLVAFPQQLEAKGHPFFSTIRVIDRCTWTPPPDLLQLALQTGQTITCTTVDIVS